MPTINVNIVTGADDGRLQTSAGASANNIYNAPYITVGQSSSAQIWGGFRFQSINIAQGVTINSATLTFIKSLANQGSPSIKIYGENVDNAPAWGAANRIWKVARTSQNTALDITNSTSANDVTAIVQAIVNRSGWTNNHAMAFILRNQHATGNSQNVWYADAFEKGAPDIPNLSVTYTSGGSQPTYGVAAAGGTEATSGTIGWAG